MNNLRYNLKIISLALGTTLLFGGCGNTTSSLPFQNKSKETKVESNKEITNKEATSNKESKQATEVEPTKEIEEPKVEETKVDKKKLIVLDPGHGNRSNLEKESLSPDSSELKIKDGGGAQGINSKTPEHVITMAITTKLKTILEREGYNVIMTKTMASESLGNIERAEVGNKNNADLVLRIHADSAENSNASGASMLVPAPVGYVKDKVEISRKYGEIILQSLTDQVGMANRGVVQRADMTGFNWSKVPVVLVETGFLSNPEEDRLLNSEEYQQKIAEALFDGIKKALD